MIAFVEETPQTHGNMSYSLWNNHDMANQHTYNKRVEYRGEVMTVSEMAERYNLKKKTIYKHLSKYGNLEAFDERLKRGNVGGAITYKGRTMGATAWGKELGLTTGQVRGRWQRHKSLDKPPSKKRVIEYKGERHTYDEWAEKLGVTANALKIRMRKYGTLDTGNPRKERSMWEHKGDKHTISEWSKILNVHENTLRRRLKTRGSIEKAEHVRKVKYKGEHHTIAEWSKTLNKPANTLYSRIRRRGTLEESSYVSLPMPPKHTEPQKQETQKRPLNQVNLPKPQKPQKKPKPKETQEAKVSSKPSKKRKSNAPILKNGHTTTYLAFLAELEKARKEEEAEDLKPLRYYV